MCKAAGLLELTRAKKFPVSTHFCLILGFKWLDKCFPFFLRLKLTFWFFKCCSFWSVNHFSFLRIFLCWFIFICRTLRTVVRPLWTVVMLFVVVWCKWPKTWGTRELHCVYRRTLLLTWIVRLWHVMLVLLALVEVLLLIMYIITCRVWLPIDLWDTAIGWWVSLRWKVYRGVRIWNVVLFAL